MANGKIRFGKQSGGQLALVIPDGASNTNLVLPESGTVVSVGTTVTDNAIVRFDGTTGKVQNSEVIIDDNGNLGINTTPYSRLDLGGGSSGLNQISWHTNSTTSYGNIWTSRNGASTIIGCGLKGSSTVNDGFESSVGTAWAKSAISVEYGYIKFYTGKIDTIPYGTAYTPTERVIINDSGDLLLTSGTGTIGYGNGAGGTVTQLTSKSTTVTLNKPTGNIITHNASLAANTTVTFALVNSTISKNDSIYCSISRSGTNSSAYRVVASWDDNGYCNILLTNTTASSLSDIVTIKFVVTRGAIA